MTQMSRRRARLRVGQFTIDSEGGLDFSFDAEKDLKKHPNSASVKIYNLTEDKRRQIESLSQKIMSIEVGYEGQDLLEIFRGDIRLGSNTVTDRGDAVVTLEAADGERAFRGARTNRAFRRGTNLQEVAETLVQDLRRGGAALLEGQGIDQALESVTGGNLTDALQGQLAGGRRSSATHGTVVTGSAADELDRLVRSHGLEWSIQGGAIQVLRAGEGINPPVILTSEDPNSGVIGSPEIDSEGTLNVRSLISAELFPGRLVRVKSKYVDVNGRIERAKYSGETFSSTFYVDLEIKWHA